jgi:hypothetical protein
MHFDDAFISFDERDDSFCTPMNLLSYLKVSTSGD